MVSRHFELPKWLPFAVITAFGACSTTPDDGTSPGSDDGLGGTDTGGTGNVGGSSGAETGGSTSGGSGPSGGVGGTELTGGSPAGGSATGGTATGGSATGGTATGGSATGGSATGGSATGGSSGAPPTGGASGAGAGGLGGASGRGGSAGSSTGGKGGGSGGLGFFVGNITTQNNVDTDGEVFSRHWDQITPENAGKWGSVQSSAGSTFNWRTLDAIYDYAETNGIIFKQHAFVWGSQQPGGSINEAAVKNWMTEFCRRYPNTRMIDVVNEPPPHTTPSYANSIGGGTNGNWQWVTNSFVWAREACPNAVLILNDFNNIEWTNDTNHFINIVTTIKAAGAPIDAVGAQAHDLDNGAVSFNTVQTLLTRLSTQTNLPVYITEMDISTSDDAAQLRLYQQYFPYFRDSSAVRGITIWGWIYGKTWSAAPQSGLIRNGAPRPAMTWLMEQLGRPVP